MLTYIIKSLYIFLNDSKIEQQTAGVPQKKKKR